MAEIKNGVKYEITADDKASNVAARAAKNLEKSAKDVGETFQGEFNPMSSIMAGISGNTEALAQQMLGLVSRLKQVHMTMMSFSIYAALVMALVKAVSVFSEKLAEARTKADEIKLDRIEGSLAQINEDQERLNEEFDKAIEKANTLAANIAAELDATEKLTNARREYNKALELSKAKTEDEKASIERKYSAEAEQAKGEAEKSRIGNERERLHENINVLRERLDEQQRSYWGQEQAARKAGRIAMSAAGRNRESSSGLYLGMSADAAAGERAVQQQAAALKGMQASQRAIESIENQIEAAEKSLALLDSQEERVDTEMKTAALKAETAEKDAREKAAAEAKAKEDAERAAAKRVAEAKATEARKAAEDDAKAQEAAQLKANRRVMEDRRRQLAALTAQESEAAARVAAAQSKVAEAWGWYRNKDSMAAQLKEEKAEAEARKQFEKDFEDLKFRRDWRTAKDLSVDEEAVRRVALAREEETAAQKALAETAASTAKAAASLAEIEKVITQEG